MPLSSSGPPIVAVLPEGMKSLVATASDRANTVDVVVVLLLTIWTIAGQ